MSRTVTRGSPSLRSRPASQKRAHEDALIDRFLAFLRHRAGVELEVHSHPDRETRDQDACDALLCSPGDPATVAAEVSSLDPYPQSRFDDALLNRLLAQLDDDAALVALAPGLAVVRIDVGGLLSPRLRNTPPGTFRDAVRRALLREIPLMNSNGSRVIDVPPWGVRLELQLDQDDPVPGVYICRAKPADLEDQRAAAMRRLLTKKATQLLPRKEAGLATTLILEAADMALTRPALVVAALERVAAAEPTALAAYDNIILIETERYDWRVTPLRMTTWPSVSMTSWRLGQESLR